MEILASQAAPLFTKGFKKGLSHITIRTGASVHPTFAWSLESGMWNRSSRNTSMRIMNNLWTKLVHLKDRREVRRRRRSEHSCGRSALCVLGHGERLV